MPPGTNPPLGPCALRLRTLGPNTLKKLGKITIYVIYVQLAIINSAGAIRHRAQPKPPPTIQPIARAELRTLF